MVDPTKLKRCGKNLRAYEFTKIIMPEAVSIGDDCILDDFVFLQGGKRLEIGDQVHIASFVSITGGGEVIVGECAAIASGVKILCGTDRYVDDDGNPSAMTASALKGRSPRRGKVVLDRHCFIGANSVVLPDVTIGEGAVVGAMSLVRRDVEPWSINVGIPCRKIGDRPKYNG